MGTRRGSGGFLKIDLGGGIGNPAVAGACVPTYLEPGAELVWEVYAGSGYLLQSPPASYACSGHKNRNMPCHAMARQISHEDHASSPRGTNLLAPEARVDFTYSSVTR